MIDTRRAPHREVHYDVPDDIVSDAERLVAAGAPTTGNWSKGQILNHLAKIMNKCIDGFENRPHAVVRFLARLLFKNRALRRTLPAGYQLKGKSGEELLPTAAGDQEALDGLKQAVDRMKQESNRAPHPFIGPLTVDEWNRLHCRHAELHMGFISDR